ncbi:MAG: glycosyl hydrolase family 18 protein [candidate division WOR-3 bacterium]
MRKILLTGLLCGVVFHAAAQSIHWLESEQHRETGAKPGPVFRGTPSPLIARDEPTVTRSIYGYSPYWVDQRWLHYDLLDRIGLFDVTLNPDGSISNNSNFPQHWAAVIDRAHRNGVKVEMVATCFDWPNIHGAIRAPGSIPNLIALAESSGVDGINLDFEGLWYGDRDTFTLFVRRMSAACRAAGLDLTLATPPLNQENAYNLAALADTSDGLFLMGYDFHWRGCPEAGPVAPLSGWTFYGNLQMAINHYLGQIGHMRDVWFGLPYYGYQWPTYADTVRSRTTGPGTAVYYRDAPANAQAHGYRWNAEGQSPWYAFNSGGWYQCWFDDDTSLLLRYREVHKHNMLGAGMWALGYDGARPELWAALRESFNRPRLEFTNGDCETWRLDTLAVPSDTSPNPAGWYEGRKARYRRETVTVRSGVSSIRHIPDSLGYTWPVESKLFQDVAALPGTNYEFSGWSYKNDGQGNRVRLLIQWHDSAHNVISTAASATLTTDSAGWRYLTTGSVPAPTGTIFARLVLWLEGRGGSDYWDDISFSPVTGFGKERSTPYAQRHTPGPTVVRRNLLLTGSPGASLSWLQDAAGRRVAELKPGPNDVRHLCPGVYFVHSTFDARHSTLVTRVVVTR